MPVDPVGAPADPDDLVTGLYDAACRLAVRRGFEGTYGEVVIALMDALRARAREGSQTSHRPGAAGIIPRPAPSRPDTDLRGDPR
jgi:hypothetical protein